MGEDTFYWRLRKKVGFDPQRLKAPLVTAVTARLNRLRKTLSLGLTRSYNGDTLWPVTKSRRKTLRSGPPTRTLKDDVVRMRVSAEQKQALAAAAERDGLELSAWLRQLALRAAGVLPEAK